MHNKHNILWRETKANWRKCYHGASFFILALPKNNCACAFTVELCFCCCIERVSEVAMWKAFILGWGGVVLGGKGRDGVGRVKMLCVHKMHESLFMMFRFGILCTFSLPLSHSLTLWCAAHYMLIKFFPEQQLHRIHPDYFGKSLSQHSSQCAHFFRNFAVAILTGKGTFSCVHAFAISMAICI